jgi:transposase
MTRRKFTSKFKTKVVLEALKERQTTQQLAQKFEISPQQINLWKREFLSQADTVFVSVPNLRIQKLSKGRAFTQGNWPAKSGT